jgi:hypothetical protein
MNQQHFSTGLVGWDANMRCSLSKNTFLLRTILVATLLIGGGFASMAGAAPILPPVTVYINGIDVTGTFGSGDCIHSAAGLSYASVCGFPDPTLTVSAIGYDASAYAELDYAFEVTGPDNIYVPFILSGVNTVITNVGYLSRTSEFVYGDGGTGVVGTTPEEYGGSIPGQNWTGESQCSSYAEYDTSIPGRCETRDDGSRVVPVTGTILSNTVGHIQLFAMTFSAFTVGDGNPYPGPGFASIDPTLSIDPTFAQADQFSLAFSDGIGNISASSTVPEPSTLALFGISLIGFVASRRHSISMV